jgi:hypothetical protein
MQAHPFRGNRHDSTSRRVYDAGVRAILRSLAGGLTLLAMGAPGALAGILTPLPDAPRGDFVELHSCELFAGSCVVSSEAHVAGNYLLRTWRFDAGEIAGVPLRGLRVALLEKGDENLAVPESPASAAVAYLEPGVTAAQRGALLTWLRARTAAPLDAAHVRTVSLAWTGDAGSFQFAAGDGLRFKGGTPASCDVGGCGEMLWYEPRDGASSFTVDQLDTSSIAEPRLGLHWSDHGRRTLFVGRFGDKKALFPALCGPPMAESR